MKIIESGLEVVCMCWSLVFLDYRTRADLLILSRKGKEFWKKDLYLVTIPINASFSSSC